MGGEFKWRHFAGEVILLCVRWYCRYGISYRDLEEMMLDAEADRLCGAARYERSEARRDTRAGSYTGRCTPRPAK